MCCEAVVGSVVWGWVDRRAGPGFLVPSAVPCGEIEQCARMCACARVCVCVCETACARVWQALEPRLKGRRVRLPLA